MGLEKILFYFTTTIILLLDAGVVKGEVSSFAYPRRFDSTQSDKEILDTLVHKNRYDKRIKPPILPINVNVSVELLSLSSPDESSLNYEVEFLMHQKWTDPRLAHSHKNSDRRLYALSHHSDIWKPDIYLLKHGTYKGISPSEVELKVFQNGTIFYTMRRHLVLNCEGDLPIFPFDSPMCSFNIESVSNERNQMAFYWVGLNAVQEDGEAGIMGHSPVLKNHNAYLIHNETLYCDSGEEWRGNFSCLQVRLHFTRDKWFYYTTVFVPGLILVTSSFVTFWIEWNAEPARVMLGVTTMLNFFTTSNKFRSKLPVVSNLTAMNMWDGVCMFFIYASFLEFILVNYLARWVQDPEQQKLKRENIILDSLKVVSHSLNIKELNSHIQLHQLKQMVHPETKKSFGEEIRASLPSSNSTPTSEEEGGSRGGYTLHSVVKIDNYSRHIFPISYMLFVLYFFIRYHAIEGALSIDYYYY